MALATNRSLLGSTIFQQCNVALLNLEDPQDEIDRHYRVTALAMRYSITNQDGSPAACSSRRQARTCASPRTARTAISTLSFHLR